MSLSQQIRNGEGELVAQNITAKELQQPDNAGIPLVHQFALQQQLGLIEGKLTTKTLETIWGPGWTVAHTAAAVGDAIPLKASLRKNKHLLYWSDQHGQTPLHLAALHACLDHFEVEAFQLAIRDNVFETPMHYAALSGCLNQIAGEITPEMLMMINWSSETVLDLFTKKKQPTSASLENVIWEAQFITDPTKRTWENVTQHIGIHR
jgi:ankyrin repeat protein